ncbi:MAG: 3-oxoacyl-ACP synthase [Deltaproteobacteria bacterium RIFCSPLOWO2_12_FULL_43_16]|nr:MAG: 3-oxoacyl-ACP synthase [Deltaproteobacteria bacterium GWA2_43_19]OGQ11400.1 MAG: 3-oxoacyl-ACP synthase [Deltaproteobacteria bacterium RIFCSPHIGHO2_02_FULL_43_33]OGQ60412.1 MAG: 3-oxoacyl-ACP synthase [Deltaproteobacteria bacterium RIFCSPLOWO2_12_FULL_43_16]HBR17662.1 3-oxoacyl-ACP synthase [Deltaproteobacteria bacterium]
MIRSLIIGTGSHVPPRVLKNQDLEKMVDTSDEWIIARTGIKERRIADGETTNDIAAKAAKNALKAAGVSPKEIDLIVAGTVTPDMLFPSTACFVQSHIGASRGIAAFDVSAACSGFLYALDAADKYIRSGASKKALVIGVDLFSKIVDWKDRNTCVLFGDGAGAVVLSAEKGKRGILSTHIHADGHYWKTLYTPLSLCSSPLHDKTPERSYMKMQGNELFKVAVRTMGEACQEALDHNGLRAEDISLLIPHQANMRIIKATAERLGLPEEKVYINLDRYGNTSAGSIPLALDEAVKKDMIKKGDIILFVAFGGGLTWASAIVRW